MGKGWNLAVRDTLPVTEELELFGEADKTDGTNGGTDGEHDDAIELTDWALTEVGRTGVDIERDNKMGTADTSADFWRLELGWEDEVRQRLFVLTAEGLMSDSI